MEAVICKSLSFSYPESEYKVLKSVDLSVNKGEMCLVIGESAAGKTTLLKLMKNEIAPVGKLSGEICVNGTVGYVAQNVDESIVCDKVRSELSFGLYNIGIDSERAELLVAETASYFNLEDKLDSDISALSGGEKQMVNLASIMIMKPDILVLDEPCSQLDPISAQHFIQMVKNLHRDFGVTVIIAEHNAQDIFQYSDSIVLLNNGEISFKLSPKDAVANMKTAKNHMLASAPVYMTLFDNAYSVSACRDKLSACKIGNLTDCKIKNDVALKIKNLFFAYDRGKDIINDLNLKIYSGKINVVVGPNSSGKSTLLKLIAGVCKPYRGKIRTDKKISMLCQNVFDLFTKDTCGEEVTFGELTEYLGINDIKEKHPYDISGGQAQRLALAKVLETGADIILLDEPTKGFDPVIKQKLAQLLSELCMQGKTILLVTHDIEFAGQYADIVSFLSRGRIITTASRRSFFSDLNMYTTAVSKITNGLADNIVSIDDLVQAGGIYE